MKNGPRKLLLLLFQLIGLLFCLQLAAYILRQFSDLVTQMYLPTTPPWAIEGLFVLCAGIAVRSGAETIFRCASGFFFVVFATVTFSPFLVIKELNLDRTIALFTHLELRPLWDAVYLTTPWFGEAFLVLFLWPRIAEAQRTFRTLFVTAIITSVYTAVYFVLCMLLFGPTVTHHLTYPVLEMVRYIQVGDFLENMDPFLQAIWTSSLFIKVSMLLYTAVLLASQMLKLHNGRPITFAIAVLMLGLSLHMADNVSEMESFFLSSWATFAWCVELLPILYFSIEYMLVKFRHRATG